MFERYKFFEGLTSLFGSNGTVLIGAGGELASGDGKDLDLHYDSEGFRCISCSGWNGFCEYRVADLIAIQFKFLQLPLEQLGRVRAFHLDGDKDNLSFNNIGYRFAPAPFESTVFPGYFYIPGVPRILISKVGKAIYRDSGKPMSFSRSKSVASRGIRGGYFSTNVTIAKNTVLPVSRHRLLILAFTDFPDNVDSLWVNHINGSPGDDRLENIELITPRENNIHAYMTDLKSQNKRVLVRNVVSGAITEFYSISECARRLGYATDETIRHRLIRASFGKVFSDGNQLKFKDDPRDWPVVENPAAVIASSIEEVAMSCVAKHCLTGDTVRFSSITECARFLNVSSGTIQHRLKLDPSAPVQGYLIKKETDENPWPYFSMERYWESLTPNSIGVVARNLVTDEVRSFKSIRELGRSIPSAANITSSNLSDPEQPLTHDGWQIKKEGDKWETVSDFEESLYRKQKTVSGRNEETGVIVVAESSAKMSSLLNLDPKAIRVAAMTRGYKLYHGYRFRLGLSSDDWPTTA